MNRLLLFLSLCATSMPAAEKDPFTRQEPPPVVGRWDLTVKGPEREYPSWLEVRQSGYRTLVGSYVGQFGSARPISVIAHDQGKIRCVFPSQWERRTNDVVLNGKLDGDVLRGTITDDNGKPLPWTARRSPSLERKREPVWGAPIELFNGRDRTGWKLRNPAGTNGWVVRDGVLANDNPGNDLMTERKFTDFKLHVEFRYPKDSNSGIYLRGRYEAQIQDDFGKEATDEGIGSIYGFLTPCVNAARKPGEWQTFEITLVGRTVTVLLNDERVIDRQIIPGITGGALDSEEDKPGPILLQGDHGRIEFRKVVLAPADAT